MVARPHPRWLVACRLLVFPVATIAVLGACSRVRPIYNVKDVTLATSPGSVLTMEQVSKAIWTAGRRLRWQIVEVRPGEMTGTLKLRSHVAVVSILHDTSRFSITYKDSTNLLHSNAEIHRNYNNWIRNLERQIQVEVGNSSSGR
jgi:hypothetical protein